MRRNHIKMIKKLVYISLLTYSVAAFSACSKSTISMKEEGERLKDVGHDFVTGERTVTTNEFKREAYNAAVEYIQDNLSNPSTASFSDCDEDHIADSTDGDDLYYTMVIDVTSENESGNTETINYYVKVLSEYPDYEVTEMKEVN